MLEYIKKERIKENEFTAWIIDNVLEYFNDLKNEEEDNLKNKLFKKYDIEVFSEEDLWKEVSLIYKISFKKEKKEYLIRLNWNHFKNIKFKRLIEYKNIDIWEFDIIKELKFKGL